MLLPESKRSASALSQRRRPFGSLTGRSPIQCPLRQSEARGVWGSTENMDAISSVVSFLLGLPEVLFATATVFIAEPFVSIGKTAVHCWGNTRSRGTIKNSKALIALLFNRLRFFSLLMSIPVKDSQVPRVSLSIIVSSVPLAMLRARLFPRLEDLWGHESSVFAFLPLRVRKCV